MRRNRNARFVPLVVFPAILPAILMPLLRHTRVPDSLLGGLMGISIGLSIVALVWMAKNKRGLSGDCSARR